MTAATARTRRCGWPCARRWTRTSTRRGRWRCCSTRRPRLRARWRRCWTCWGWAGWRGEEQAPAELLDKARERDEARAERDFARADAVRDEIEAAGWEVRDTAGGTVLYRRHGG